MSIKRLNDTEPGVRRPFRVSDVQDLWTALNQILASDVNSTRILSGFEWDEDDNLTAGVLAHNGQLYFYAAEPGDKISEGDDIYLSVAPSGDQRRFANGLLYEFSSDYKVTTTPIQSGPVASATRETIERLKTPFLGGQQITTYMLRDLAVTAAKLAASSVTADKLASASVTLPKLQGSAKPSTSLMSPSIHSVTIGAGQTDVEVNMQNDGLYEPSKNVVKILRVSGSPHSSGVQSILVNTAFDGRADANMPATMNLLVENLGHDGGTHLDIIITNRQRSATVANINVVGSYTVVQLVKTNYDIDSDVAGQDSFWYMPVNTIIHKQ